MSPVPMREVSISKLQQDFTRALLSADDDGIMSAVSGGNSSEIRRRLDIYRNNVFHSLSTALADLYPVVMRLVGEQFFQATAAEYIRQRPPRQAAMVFFAGDFPEFIANFSPARQLPYLPDVARLELAWHRCYHASDHSTLSAEQFSLIEPEKLACMRIRLHPSVQLLSSSWPVLTIWSANQEGGSPEQVIDLDAGGETACIYRPDFEVHVDELDSGTLVLLQALVSSDTLGQALAAALATHQSFDPALALGRCISNGLFAEFKRNHSSGENLS